MKASKAKTKQEMQDEFLDYLWVLINYWSKQEGSKKDALSGLAHSILVIFDGESTLPAMDVVPAPHPDDKQYCVDQGEDYYPEGMNIADGTLHEQLYKHE